MRISQRQLQRNFTNSLNTNLKRLSGSNDRLTTGRRFNRVSENVTDATKALKVRHQITKNEQYLSNIDKLHGELSVQETGAMQMNDMMTKLKELMVNAASGTNGADQREIIAREVGNIKENILQIINSQSVEKYTFSNTSNSTPITFDPITNKVLYNGIDVDSAVLRSDFNDHKVFVDIGSGMKIASGILDPSTTAQLTTAAIDVLGFGTNSNGIPKNIISLLDAIVVDLKNNDSSKLDLYNQQLSDSQTNLLVSVTDIGARIKYVESSEARIDQELISLAKLQNNLEAVDLEEEVIFNKGHEMAWQISLQIGNKVLPQSIFDFMR